MVIANIPPMVGRVSLTRWRFKLLVVTSGFIQEIHPKVQIVGYAEPPLACRMFWRAFAKSDFGPESGSGTGTRRADHFCKGCPPTGSMPLAAFQQKLLCRPSRDGNDLWLLPCFLRSWRDREDRRNQRAHAARAPGKPGSVRSHDHTW